MDWKVMSQQPSFLFCPIRLEQQKRRGSKGRTRSPGVTRGHGSSKRMHSCALSHFTPSHLPVSFAKASIKAAHILLPDLTTRKEMKKDFNWSAFTEPELKVLDSFAGTQLFGLGITGYVENGYIKLGPEQRKTPVRKMGGGSDIEQNPVGEETKKKENPKTPNTLRTLGKT